MSSPIDIGPTTVLNSSAGGLESQDKGTPSATSHAWHGDYSQKDSPRDVLMAHIQAMQRQVFSCSSSVNDVLNWPFFPQPTSHREPFRQPVAYLDGSPSLCLDGSLGAAWLRARQVALASYLHDSLLAWLKLTTLMGLVWHSTASAFWQLMARPDGPVAGTWSARVGQREFW
ncbi:hypothetical protein VNO77_14953 [Canavalia gladiata]|uniref:Uncharacterized protein n=1 Tax=Canavalia gladiata TaxID=3824 RepID=A0AAN9QNY4_CANGL